MEDLLSKLQLPFFICQRKPISQNPLPKSTEIRDGKRKKKMKEKIIDWIRNLPFVAGLVCRLLIAILLPSPTPRRCLHFICSHYPNRCPSLIFNSLPSNVFLFYFFMFFPFCGHLSHLLHSSHLSSPLRFSPSLFVIITSFIFFIFTTCAPIATYDSSE